MKTKMLALLLSLTLFLTACATKPSDTTEPPAPTYPQAAEASGDQIRIGQYRTEIPDTFELSYSDERTITLSSTDHYCIVSLLAYDMSDSSEDDIRHQMVDMKSTMSEDNEMEVAFSDIDPTGYLWVELSENMNPITCIRTIFTDSWYVYQIDTLLLPGFDETDAMSQSIALLMSFVADDVPARFDFIQ